MSVLAPLSRDQTAIRSPTASKASWGSKEPRSVLDSSSGGLQPPPGGRLAVWTTGGLAFALVQTATAIPAASNPTCGPSASSSAGERSSGGCQAPPTL